MNIRNTAIRAVSEIEEGIEPSDRQRAKGGGLDTRAGRVFPGLPSR
jgi:hypothetical protein